MSEVKPPLRRAVLLMTGSSFLVPAAGILTQPILAHGLGVSGRGELAAALAPHLLAVAVATLGLPDALTYYLAKYPSITRPALLRTIPICAGLTAICFLAVLLLLPFLSSGNPELRNLILLAAVLTLPSLIVGVFRGAAVGRQMWAAVAAERLVSTVLRVIIFIALTVCGRLTVFSALLVLCLAPIAAGLVFWRLFLSPPHDAAERPLDGGVGRLLLSYGNRVWFGSVASMLLDRIGLVLMAPLSSIESVGLYSVANTISDLPLIVALAIAGAVFGVNSKEKDAVRVVLTARLTLLGSLVGCAVLGFTVPWWIEPLFGAEFDGAVIPTLMLLLSAVLCVPGLIAATGIGAWGRPGLRSIGLAVTLFINVATFVLLVPPLGAIGACWASIVSNFAMSAYMVTVASRVMKVAVAEFVVLRRSDLARAWVEAKRLISTLMRRRVRMNS